MFKIFGLILASDTSLMRYIDKTLESKTESISAVNHSLIKSQGSILSTLETSNKVIEELRSSIVGNQAEITELESNYAELQNKLDEYPSSDDIVTSETFGNELENNDIVTRDDLSDFVEGDAVMDHVDFSDVLENIDLDDLTSKVMEKMAEKFSAVKT